VKLADGVYEADAGETVDALFEFMEYEDPEDNEDFLNMPISEWALSSFQAVPKERDSFRYHRVQITVAKMDHNRILKVRADILPEEEAAPEETAEPSEPEGTPSEEGGEA
jgi:CBS domain containing-hemolysin-like protein